MKDRQIYQQSFGVDVSAEVIANTTARTAKNYQLIYFVENTVIAAITAPKLTGAASLVGKTFAAGSQLCTQVTAITLTSGTCIAYDGV